MNVCQHRVTSVPLGVRTKPAKTERAPVPSRTRRSQDRCSRPERLFRCSGTAGQTTSVSGPHCLDAWSSSQASSCTSAPNRILQHYPWHLPRASPRPQVGVSHKTTDQSHLPSKQLKNASRNWKITFKSTEYQWSRFLARLNGIAPIRPRARAQRLIPNMANYHHGHVPPSLHACQEPQIRFHVPSRISKRI